MHFWVRIFLLIMLFSPSYSYCQEDEQIIDSLKNVLKDKSIHDTTRLKTIMAWDAMIYYNDPELDVELNNRIISLTEEKANLIDKASSKVEVWIAS